MRVTAVRRRVPGTVTHAASTRDVNGSGNDIPMCILGRESTNTYGMCVRFHVRVEIARDIHSGESAPTRARDPSHVTRARRERESRESARAGKSAIGVSGLNEAGPRGPYQKEVVCD